MIQTAAAEQTGLPLAALVAAGVLIAAQLLVTQLRGDVSPSSGRFRSIAGGLAVGYVFARLLPQLAASSTSTSTEPGRALELLQRHPFLVALVGLLAWFAVLDLAQHSCRYEQDRGEPSRIPWPFYASVALYFVFNLFVGYLLVHQIRPGLTELALYTIALSARYVVGEFALRAQDPHAYDRVVRWLLAAGVFLGWAAGAALDLPSAVLSPLSALLTGSIILTSLHQQVPAPGRARFTVFGSTCIAYTALLLLL